MSEADVPSLRLHTVLGDDDYLVRKKAQEIFDRLLPEYPEEFQREIIGGHAGRVDEVKTVVDKFRQAAQTLSLFGDGKLIWLRDVDFLADSPTGRAEGTLAEVERLQGYVEKLGTSGIQVVLSASPVDRRRKFSKWLEKTDHFTEAATKKDRGAALRRVVDETCEECGVTIGPDAFQLLVGLINGNTRLAVEEIRKLATFIGAEGGIIDEKLVTELVPPFGEGDFFEAAEAFSSFDLAWTLDALTRHFFHWKEARPLLASMQGRNRLMIQLRVLLDAGEISLGARGISKADLEKAAAQHADCFGESDEKNGFNVFTQNPWYLGRLALGAKKPPKLRNLIDIQTDLFRTFEEIIARPDDHEGVMKDLAVRCLS
ncbi:MAG: DNA polymerase III subunit delta [Opitutales bacterium]|nr:DNA polymerase III subunit delta [Opitutales bacterium]|tara:strand:+ start:254 stop:1369 length:1116 start_codon:yes stop_codon:yes gene_type:complete